MLKLNRMAELASQIVDNLNTSYVEVKRADDIEGINYIH